MSQSGVIRELTEDERELFIAFAVLGFCMSQAQKKRKFSVETIQKVIENQPAKFLVLNNRPLFFDGLRCENEAGLSPEYKLVLRSLKAKVKKAF